MKTLLKSNNCGVLNAKNIGEEVTLSGWVSCVRDLGGIIFLVLINFLFKIAKSYTYFAIIGFVLGSVFVIYPGFSFNTQGIISIVLLIASFIAGIKLSNLNT